MVKAAKTKASKKSAKTGVTPTKEVAKADQKRRSPSPKRKPASPKQSPANTPKKQTSKAKPKSPKAQKQKANADESPKNSKKNSIPKNPIEEENEEISEEDPFAVSPKKTIKKKSKQDGDLNLFEMLQNKVAPSVVADQWIDSFLSDFDAALRELVNLVLAAAGSPKLLTTALDEQETAAEIGAFGHTAPEDGYPLKTLSRFDKLFDDFFLKLVKKAYPKKILDSKFLGNLDYWLVVISSCGSRSFRFSGTVAALRIMTALNDILAQQAKELNATETQLKAESRFGSTNRFTTLTQKKNRLKTAMSELKDDLLNGLFKHIFTLRYRDVEAEIRTLCISALGHWTAANPSVWLSDDYLKYLGWLSYDTDTGPRLASLKGVLQLLSEESNHETMNLFLERFRDRFVQATLDKDPACAVVAVKIANQLLSAGVLEEKELADICGLTSDRDVKIRHAAGEFVFNYIFVGLAQSDPDASVEPKAQQKKAELIKLIEFTLKTSLIPLPHYLIDALWGKLYVLTDWEAQVSLLQSIENKAQQTLLAQILLCCIKKALGFAITPGQSKGTGKAVSGANEAISKYFMENLPELLNFFRTETNVLTELVEIPRYLDLDNYKKFHLESKFSPLLQALGSIFAKTASKELIESIGATFQLLLSDHPLKKQAEKVIAALAQKLDSHLAKGSSASVFNLQKVASLFLIYDLTDYGFPDRAVAALKQKYNEEERRAVIPAAIRVLLLDAAHTVNLLLEQKQPTSASLSHVIEKRERLLPLLQKYLEDEDNEVQLRVFPLAVETLMIFKRGWTNTPLSLLAYSATDAFHEAILKCVEANISLTVDEITSEDAQVLADAVERQELLIEGLDRAIVTSNLRKEAAVPVLLAYTEMAKQTQVLAKKLYHDLKTIYEHTEYAVIFETLKLKWQVDQENLKTLARALASLNGVEVTGKVQRTNLIKLARAALDWVFESDEDRFDFLEDGLRPFISKLPTEDVVGFVVPHWEAKLSEIDAPDHPSFNAFRDYIDAAKSGQRRSVKPKAKGKTDKASKALDFNTPKKRSKPNHDQPPPSQEEVKARGRSASPKRKGKAAKKVVEEDSEEERSVSPVRKQAKKAKQVSEEEVEGSEQEEESPKAKRAKASPKTSPVAKKTKAKSAAKTSPKPKAATPKKTAKKAKSPKAKKNNKK